MTDKTIPSISFLEDSAKYFENRPTGGEDKAHWSNVYNALNCREAAIIIERLSNALHAAIDAPKGVVPDCASEFYDQNHRLFDKYTTNNNSPKTQ